MTLSGSGCGLVKSARVEVWFELSSKGAKVAGKRHSRPREQLLQKAGGEKRHGVFEPCYSKCGVWTSVSPNCSLPVRDKILTKGESRLS